jgi:hypothetical protein
MHEKAPREGLSTLRGAPVPTRQPAFAGPAIWSAGALFGSDTEQRELVLDPS